MAKTKVVVKVPKRGEGITLYRRGGVTLAIGENIVEVDEAQLKALEKDPTIAVESFQDEKKPEGGKK